MSEKNEQLNIKYCAECMPGKACGKYHIYIIELEKEVRKNYTFKLENPHLPPEKSVRCFYVGMTRHKPTCRFKQHIEHYPHRIEYAKDQSTKPGTMYCYCKGKKQKKIFKPQRGIDFVWGSKIVGRYGKELRLDLFHEYNPIKLKREAGELEKDIARDLRQSEYGASVGGEENYLR